MAAPTKLVFFSFLLFLALHLNSEMNIGKGYLFADAVSHNNIKSRKVVYVLGGKKVVFNIEPKRENGLIGRIGNKWEELRRVPAGPDPLHHNGSGPKKPRNFP